MKRKIEVREINPGTGLMPKTGPKSFMVVLTEDGKTYRGTVGGVAINALMRAGGMRTQIFCDGRARIEGIDGDLHA